MNPSGKGEASMNAKSPFLNRPVGIGLFLAAMIGLGITWAVRAHSSQVLSPLALIDNACCSGLCETFNITTTNVSDCPKWEGRTGTLTYNMVDNWWYGQISNNDGSATMTIEVDCDDTGDWHLNYGCIGCGPGTFDCGSGGLQSFDCDTLVFHLDPNGGCSCDINSIIRVTVKTKEACP
jgi:hypothetical protein